VLYLLGGRLAQPLPAGEYFISVISELELLAYTNITEDEDDHIKAFWRTSLLLNSLPQLKRSH
jgi:hypothetical protein